MFFLHYTFLSFNLLLHYSGLFYHYGCGAGLTSPKQILSDTQQTDYLYIKYSLF